MPETSKLATPAFVGFSLSIAALYWGLTKPHSPEIGVILTLYGIVIVMIEAIKHHDTLGKIFYGSVLPIIWSVIIMFTTRDILINAGYNDSSNPDDYVQTALILSSSAVIATLLALLAVEFWDRNSAIIESKLPLFLKGLAGNHVGFVVSGAFLFAIYFAI